MHWVRISGIPAYILLRVLDLTIAAKFKGKLSCWRYSDEIIIVGADRCNVIGAARAICRWTGDRRLGVKAVAS